MRITHKIKSTAFWIATLTGGLTATGAQAQAPDIGGILPAGGPRGQVTQIHIDGHNLQGARLRVLGNGITVKSQQVSAAGDSLTAEVMVDAGANLGPHDVRIATAKGVSNGSRFWVDIYPNRMAEPPKPGEPIPLTGTEPLVFNGRLAQAAKADKYVINAAAGETWVFDCFADRLRSRLDPVLELSDESGVTQRLVQSTWESDPHFFHKFEKSGRYILTLHDSEFKGGPNFTYRLLAGHLPYISGYLPRGERAGRPVQIAFQGVNLASATSTVSIPAGAAAGTFWAEVRPGAGMPFVLPLMVESDPVMDAGDTGALRPLPSLPAVIDGVFGRAPRAQFAFHAVPGTHYLIDLLGRRIGSRIDGEIRVLKGTPGMPVSENDDAPNLGKDARLDFVTQDKDSDFIIEVRNVEEVTGQDCYYRLKVTPVVPDFQAAIASDSLAVPAGATTIVPVTVERAGGFNGLIEVRAEGLPAGVTCSSALIAPGKNTGELTLTAAPDSALTDGEIHLVGIADIGGKPVRREAPAWEKYEHRSIDLVLSVEYGYDRPHHLWDLLLLAVTDQKPPVVLTTPAAALTLAPGGTLEIPVHAARQPNANGEIKLELRNLPAKVTAAVPPIAANQTDTKIVLTAAADAPADLTNLIIEAKDQKTAVPGIHLTLRKN